MKRTMRPALRWRAHRRRANGRGNETRVRWPSTVSLLALSLTLACSSSPSDVQMTELAEGTWGNERVGVIVSDTNAHVHVNCTSGDFPAPIPLDDDQRFTVEGSYLVKAYPVAMGPPMPAVFAGVVVGRELTFTVAVNDTIDERLDVLGPVTAVLGREPEMGQCPICERPGAERPGAEPRRRGLLARLFDWIAAFF